MREIPHSDEAERAILGSIMLDPWNAMAKAYNGKITADSFYDRRHQKLYQTFVDMYADGNPIDTVTIIEYLKDKEVLDAVGGYSYLTDLQNSTLVAAHVDHYATIVREDKRVRDVIEILSDGIEVAYRGDDSSAAVMGLLAGLSSVKYERSLEDHAELFLEKCREGTFGSFGWWCDEWTRRLGKMTSDLMIIHAPRSTGKTALMIQWIVEAHQRKQRTPLASIEMLRGELAPRLVATIGQVGTFRMRTRGHITADEEHKSLGAINTIKHLNLTVRDKGMNIDDICAWAITEREKSGADAIFIDNLLCISDGGKQYQSKTIMYDTFIKRLRDLRDQLEIPIILLAHPNAEGGIAWSKDVENIADIILYLKEVPAEGFIIKSSGKTVMPLELSGRHVMGVFQKNRQGECPIYSSMEFEASTQTFRHIGWE